MGAFVPLVVVAFVAALVWSVLQLPLRGRRLHKGPNCRRTMWYENCLCFSDPVRVQGEEGLLSQRLMVKPQQS